MKFDDDKDCLLEKLAEKRKVLKNVDIWKKIRLWTAIVPTICMTMAFGINAIVPSLLWIGNLGIVEVYVLYKEKNTKKSIKNIESMLEKNESDDVVDDMVVEKKDSLDHHLSYEYNNSRPYTRVRIKCERISSRLR